MSAAEKKIAQQRAAAKAAEKTGFLYAPVGWQREDMGRALYERGGLFKRVLRDARAGRAAAGEAEEEAEAEEEEEEATARGLTFHTRRVTGSLGRGGVATRARRRPVRRGVFVGGSQPAESILDFNRR